MTTVLTLNLDGSLQEVRPVTVSLGASSAASLVALNSFGQFDSSVLPTISVSLLSGGSNGQVLTSLAGTPTWLSQVLPSYSQPIGDGVSTTIVVTHNLGTQHISIGVFETFGAQRKVDSGLEIQNTDINTITLIFNSAPSMDAYMVNIFTGSGSSVPVSAILASGIKDSTTVLYGNGTWATPPSESGGTSSVVLYTTTDTSLTAATNILLCNMTTTGTITLPVGTNNLKFTIRNIGTGLVEINPSLSDTIEFMSNLSLLPTNCIDVVYYLGNWYLI